jgi:Tfp pilus assembly protein PilF
MTSAVTALARPISSSIASPAIDLIVGCGAWSVPLLFLAYAFAGGNPIAAAGFYAVALVLNYPHYMATIYRAYGTREDFVRYRVVTVYITIFVAVALIAAHGWYRIVPWLFTLYITWSPWHYMGQNFGLSMMFIHRNGTRIQRNDRNALWAAFVASYVMIFLTFHTGSSTDPFVVSLGLPTFLDKARIPLLAFFAITGGVVLIRLIRQAGWKPMLAPLTLYVTQFLWFVLPTAVELATGARAPQASYSAGILAVMHCAQYLWITNYYARQEAKVEAAAWRWQAYFAKLIIGGIVLFIPGPWLASYVLGRDFGVSVLIFSAIVNIHHFILDGAIWKLRDKRVRSVLTSTDNEPAETTALPFWTAVGRPGRLVGGVAIALIVVLAAVDQVRYDLGIRVKSTSSMALAAAMNPYDSFLLTRLGHAYADTGDQAHMESSYRESIRVNPGSLEAQNALARQLLEAGRFADAYDHYKQMFANVDPNAEALMNFGALCKQLNHHDEALSSFERVLLKFPDYAPAHLLLGEMLDADGKTSEALSHYARAKELEARPR